MQNENIMVFLDECTYFKHDFYASGHTITYHQTKLVFIVKDLKFSNLVLCPGFATFNTMVMTDDLSFCLLALSEKKRALQNHPHNIHVQQFIHSVTKPVKIIIDSGLFNIEKHTPNANNGPYYMSLCMWLTCVLLSLDPASSWKPNHHWQEQSLTWWETIQAEMCHKAVGPQTD